MTARPLRVLAIGPLPSAREPIGGARVAFAELVRRLRADPRLRLELHDTSRPLAGRRRAARALADLRGLAALCGAILRRGRRCDLLLFNTSSGGVLAAGPFAWLLARLVRRPLALRVFGGNLDVALERLPRPLRALVARTVLRAPLVLLETEALCARFPGARRFPNTRDLPAPPERGPGGCTRFLFLSQLRPEKGLLEALEASDALPEGCTLSVHGPLLPGVGAERFARHPRARHLGEVPPGEVARVLSEHHALVFPSHYAGEGMPGVVVEALQCGLPVVATRWRSLPELVGHEVEGLLVPPRDARALAGALQRLACDALLHRRLTEGAARRGASLRSGPWHAQLAEWLLELRAARPSPIEALDARLYPRHGERWDDELLRAAVLRHLEPQHHVLDLGAGAGVVPQMDFRGLCARVCGVDPDPRVERNPHLDEGRVGAGERLPYADGSFDLVVADNVLEHLERPAHVLAEVRRVLRPGGLFLAKTPNALHYVPLIARLTPTWFHRAVNRRRGRAEADTFPTRYRANTPRRLRALARALDLEVRSIGLHEGRPEYLRLHPLAYRLGWLYERLVNRFEALAPLRVTLVAELRKPVGRAQEPASPVDGPPAALPARGRTATRAPAPKE